MAIFIQQLAILLAVIMIGGATIVVKRKWWDKCRAGSGDDDYHAGGEVQRIHGFTAVIMLDREVAPTTQRSGKRALKSPLLCSS